MKLAIVGCGGIGGNVASLIRLNRSIEITACVDTDSERARVAASAGSCKSTFASLEELLEAAGSADGRGVGNGGAGSREFRSSETGTAGTVRPDAVYLAVPHDLHLSMVRACIEHGFAVLCEKPLAHTLDDAKAIVELGSPDRRIGINYQYRFDHACYSLMRASQSGDLGEIRYVRCNVPWRRDDSYFGGDGWHARRGRAGGATLITQGSHLLDIALQCAGGTPVAATGRAYTRVFTATDVDDLFMGIVETSTGVAIDITSSMIANPEQPATIEVYGSRGTGFYWGPVRSRVRYAGVRPPRRRHPLRAVHALGRSLEGFRRWVDEGARYECTAADALPVMEAVSMLYRAAGVEVVDPDRRSDVRNAGRTVTH